MFEKFYERYAPEEKEVIVLIQHTLGAGYDNNGFWDMTVISLGMVFCATGEVNIREGRLEWPVTEEEKNSERGWKRFEREQICRIKVRKLLDEYVPKHTTPEKFNSWAVTEVLEQSVSCPELEAVLEEYNKPVVIEDKVLGTLILNREFDMFETTFLWNGNEVSFMLEVNPESKSSWSRARTAAKNWLPSRKHGMKPCGNLPQRNSLRLPTTGWLRMGKARVPGQSLKKRLRSVLHSRKFPSRQAVALLLITTMMICFGGMP